MESKSSILECCIMQINMSAISPLDYEMCELYELSINKVKNVLNVRELKIYKS